MSSSGIHHFHQPWAQLQPPPPTMSPPPTMFLEYSGRSSADEVRTIFITVLPGDVKERELRNLLRWLPGFEASQINSKKGWRIVGKAAGFGGQIIFDRTSKEEGSPSRKKKPLFIYTAS